MNDIAITGATGVAGRRTVRELVEAGHTVTGRELRDATGWLPRVRGGTDGWSLIAERRLAA